MFVTLVLRYWMQVPLTDQVIENLTRLQETPIILWTVTLLTILLIVLAFLERLLKSLNSITEGGLSCLNYWGKLRQQTVDTHNIQNYRNGVLKKGRKYVAQVLLDKRARRKAGLSQQETVNAKLTQAEPDPLKTDKILNRREPEVLKPTERLIDVFNRDEVAGRLLILGEPGAGKTTTLCELAKELIEAAEDNPGAPVPVFIELSKWSEDDASIEQWLITLLEKAYGVPKVIGRQ